MFYYLGIDLGGEERTYALALKEKEGRLFLERALSFKEEPFKGVSLKEILDFVMKERVLVTAIDAPLSFSLYNEKGYRKADRALRELLPGKKKSWVLSYHALMGIPLRGFLLAKALSPYCGAIFETHPRASLYFLLPEPQKALSEKYKKESLEKDEALFLEAFFKEKFGLAVPSSLFEKDDLVDALLCALTGYLYFKAPERLYFLPQEEGLSGFGPFVVIKSF